jgi:cell division protein FtsB
VRRASRAWIGVFAVWTLLLSGVLANLVGSPGIIQAFRLRSLLGAKQEQLAKLEADVARIEAEATRLTKSRAAQEREVRRTLSYAASDEIIFDFSAAERR